MSEMHFAATLPGEGRNWPETRRLLSRRCWPIACPSRSGVETNNARTPWTRHARPVPIVMLTAPRLPPELCCHARRPSRSQSPAGDSRPPDGLPHARRLDHRDALLGRRQVQDSGRDPSQSGGHRPDRADCPGAADRPSYRQARRRAGAEPRRHSRRSAALSATFTRSPIPTSRRACALFRPHTTKKRHSHIQPHLHRRASATGSSETTPWEVWALSMSPTTPS